LRILGIVFVVLAVAALANAAGPSGQVLTVIEKEVCFDLSVYDPVSNETVSKSICVKLEILAAPGSTNSSIVISFPVQIHLYNTTITKTVAVPLEVSGRVVAIYVKGSSPGRGDIIWATFPSPSPASPSPTAIVTATPAASPTATRPATPAAATAAATPSPSPRPTQQLVYTYTYSPMLPPPPPPQTNTPHPQPGLDTATAAVIIAVGGVTAAGLIAWRMSRKPRPAAPPAQPAPVDVLASRTIVELQKQLEEERRRRELAEKNLNIKLKCTRCGVYVSPVRLDDGTLLCPQCNSVIARINEAGGLELVAEERPEKAEKPEKRPRRSEPRVEYEEEEG